MLQPDDVFEGKYIIREMLGSGGFAIVYRAHQANIKRDVAIKLVHPAKKLGMHPERLYQRFHREGQLLAELQNEQNVRLIDFGHSKEHDALFMVMEYIDGTPLDKLIRRTGPMAPSRVVKILKQVLSALGEAHKLQILHRDVKPANIVVFDRLGEVDRAKLIDYGIAKPMRPDNVGEGITAEGSIIGTPRYMAPEQIILVNALSPATDIYSLGLVAFEMLTGHALLGDSTHTEVLKRQLSAEVFYVPQDIPAPPDLRQVINTMIVKSPRDRYQSTAEVIAALDKLDISGIQAASHASSSDVFPAAPSTMETKYDRPTTGETPYENVQQPADQSGGNVPAYPQQQQHPNPYGQPPPQGYAPYPPQGYPPGYPPQGYPPQGYPPQGYYPQNPSGSGYPPQPHQYQNPSGNYYPPNPSGVSNSSVIENISGTMSQILDPKSSGKTSYIMFGIGIVVLLVVLVTAGPGGFFRKFVGLSTCKDDSYEPNQRSLDGTVLTRGANISAHVCPGNDDWYFVGNRNPGDTVSITADFGEGSDPIAMELFIDSKFIERARTSAHGGIVSYRLKGRGAVAVRMKLAASEDGSAGRPYVITLESDQRSKPAL